jgi:hypothetical protein
MGLRLTAAVDLFLLPQGAALSRCGRLRHYHPMGRGVVLCRTCGSDALLAAAYCRRKERKKSC